MRRSFRVGTVLTGAAACAAAFGPTAAAATAGKPLPGNITEEDCTAADAHWLHLYWPAYSDHGPTCIGGTTGTIQVDHSMVGWCPGEASGDISYISADGGYSFPGFDAQGVEITRPGGSAFYVISVYISRFSGNYTCPS
jgi:hypothetical protein